MTMIINRFNPMPRYARHGIFYFRNHEQALAFVYRHGLHRDLIVQCRSGYIVKRP